MKITQIAAKPQLTKLVIDDAAILERYGEAVEFWTWDRQPLDVFMTVANAGADQQNTIIEVIHKLILDEHGNQVVRDGVTIPGDILILAIEKITAMLGK